MTGDRRWAMGEGQGRWGRAERADGRLAEGSCRWERFKTSEASTEVEPYVEMRMPAGDRWSWGGSNGCSNRAGA